MKNSNVSSIVKATLLAAYNGLLSIVGFVMAFVALVVESMPLCLLSFAAVVIYSYSFFRGLSNFPKDTDPTDEPDESGEPQ